MRLIAKLVTVTEVTAGQRDEMFALMCDHYLNVHRDVFEADLANKGWVIMIRDPDTQALCGFSTQALLTATVADRPVKALFSGDTIIHRQCWGDSALAHVWGRFALRLMDTYAGEELYWFLISQGYKTYRFLPLFFHDFYPRHDAPMSAWIKAVIHALACVGHAETYDAANGVIHATTRQYRLRPGLADVTPARLRDVHVRFFHTRNPGHTHGDELCCLAPLTRANFTPAAYRVIGDQPAAQEAS